MRFRKLTEDELTVKGGRDVSGLERRHFLKMGLAITGVFAGGSVLSAISVVDKANAVEIAEKYPYKPHYTMVLHQDRCIDCERCMEACIKTNDVPEYGYRTKILERDVEDAIGQKREFVPVLCNQCNKPPCVRACPTSATLKDKKTGIVIMKSERCIGCKTCMAACPYNARYFNEERRAIDKCNFCKDTRLDKGELLTACAAACPAGVRIFGDLSDETSDVYKTLHTLKYPVWVQRPETGAAPNVFYTRG